MKSNVNVSDIIIFATFWNEIEWIHTSLKQIDIINPRKVIICDGCFDSKYINRSTDGTYEVIKEWAKNKKNVQIISSIRKNKFSHIIDFILYKNPTTLFNSIIIKFIGLFYLMKTNNYRLNQMATFQTMLTKYSRIQNQDWFMTYDCDQFYSDDIITSIKNISDYEEFDLLTTKEFTFFQSFSLYTESYELRDYNNMPHRYIKGMRFLPTRHPSVIQNYRYVNFSDVTKKKHFVGNVFHYHVKTEERIKSGYSLGDRKPPSSDRMKTKKYYGIHPKVVAELIKDKGLDL